VPAQNLCRHSSAATDRFRIRHRPFSLTAGNASCCPEADPRGSLRYRLHQVEIRPFAGARLGNEGVQRSSAL
jgi:hypothetical protein